MNWFWAVIREDFTAVTCGRVIKDFTRQNVDGYFKLKAKCEKRLEGIKRHSREKGQGTRAMQSSSLLILFPKHLINIHLFLPPSQTRAPFSFTWAPSWLSSTHSCPLLFISILHQNWASHSCLKSFKCVPLLFGYNLQSLTLPRAPPHALAHTCFLPPVP